MNHPPPSRLQAADSDNTNLIALLETPRFELIPLNNALDQAEYLPDGAQVSVTASPAKGLTATIELAIALSDLGFDVAPHLSARMIRDKHHLIDIVSQCETNGIDHAFVMAGDTEDPLGYFDSVELLHDLETIDHGLNQIGIGGYPEGHPSISDSALLAALRTKQPHASYITTQMCFDPIAIEKWIGTVRAAGIDLPIRIGIPGAARIRRLISISAKIGVGDSVRFLAKSGGSSSNLLKPGGYAPENLLRRVLPGVLGSAAGIEGLHIYTFNDVENTERWRQRTLEEAHAAIVFASS
ncbi:MAG: methylenetetrahydrofolate reductase [Acidimicrobiia bacterium]|nr:MAG: methylenetetrahydrofolate reductase [Acidimicrobiia bacterium]